MIDWEKLYLKVCERVSKDGHNHHIHPIHTGIDDDTIVKLSFKDHVLAHYIRYRWLHEKGDRLVIQILTRRKYIYKFEDEISYKKIFKYRSLKPKNKKIKTKKESTSKVKQFKKLINTDNWNRKQQRISDKKLKEYLRSQI